MNSKFHDSDKRKTFAPMKNINLIFLMRRIMDISMHIVRIKFILNVHEEMQCQILRGRRANNMNKQKLLL